METGMCSLRKALRKGSCSDWPLAMISSPYCPASSGVPGAVSVGRTLILASARACGHESCSIDSLQNARKPGIIRRIKALVAALPAQPGQLALGELAGGG